MYKRELWIANSVNPDYTPVCVENEYGCVPSNVLCWMGGAYMQSEGYSQIIELF